MISLKTKNWQIDNIDTVIFDKDGTLIDLHYFWGKMTELRVDEVIQKYNFDLTFFDHLCDCLGYDINTQKMLPDGITALYSRPKIIELFIKDLAKFGVVATTAEIEEIFDKVSDDFYKNILDYTKPIDSAFRFVEKLYKTNIKMGIVTSDSIVSTQLTVKQFELEKYFKSLIGRESCTDIKESGKPTIMALNELNSNPKNTVMIGDAPMDYISAKNAGIDKTILIATGQIDVDELKKTSEFVCCDLDEVEVI